MDEETHEREVNANRSEDKSERKRTSTRAGKRERKREREMSGRPSKNFGEQALRGTERVPERGKAELTKPDPNE